MSYDLNSEIQQSVNPGCAHEEIAEIMGIDAEVQLFV